MGQYCIRWAPFLLFYNHFLLDFLLNHRWNYLWHILRMNGDRALRQFLLHLQLNEAPSVPGSFSPYDAIRAAQDQATWGKLRADRTNNRR